MLGNGSYVAVQQRLSTDFIALKHACPKGIYVAPIPDRPSAWAGVIFVRKGSYARAVIRFEIAFSAEYPKRPPLVTFPTDVFHPLIAPLTTYTYSAKDRGVDTISASDEETLPPGGLSLRHGFPEWYDETSPDRRTSKPIVESGHTNVGMGTSTGERVSLKPVMALESPHIIEVLQYMRLIFDTDVLIDSVPLEAAANPGAWHAWKSYRSRPVGSGSNSPSRKSLDVGNNLNRNRSMSPNKQQPGGARRPGEWNWTGVWEDRVRKAVQASISDTSLFGGEDSKLIDFVQLNDDIYDRLEPVAQARNTVQAKDSAR